MDVILLERIERLGQMGDVVKVKPGFARNYLLPQKKALRATKENREYFEKQRAQLEAQNLTRRQDAEKVSTKLDGISVIIIRQAGEFGQLYGSVTTRDIATAITGAGFTVDRRQIMLDVPIKTLGLHKTRVALHPEVTVSVTLNVAPSEEEAAMQAAGKTPGAPATPEAEAAVEAAAAAPAAAEAEAKAAEAEAPAEPKKKKAKAKKAKAEDAD
jgi:large subunit ribosomal protein L9